MTSGGTAITPVSPPWLPPTDSIDDALARHHVNLPKDGTDDLVRNAVNAGWDASSEYLSNTKERP
ncbi:hypothetical protein GCM10010317_031280 [Streptomyces mirabilis]|nr:hypothetical protein GCM10010317_031280 [Streptomyces mirabilis]